MKYLHFDCILNEVAKSSSIDRTTNKNGRAAKKRPCTTKINMNPVTETDAANQLKSKKIKLMMTTLEYLPAEILRKIFDRTDDTGLLINHR